ATVAFLMALTNLPTFIICFVIFLIMVIGTKYVSLGSIVSVIFYPLVLINVLELFKAPGQEYIGVVFAVLLAAVVVLKHKSNIVKIYNHTESKISFSKHGTDSGDKKKKDD
ncbi:MAG: glycerol-3-phosphate acyltransferase, partial [Clostridia bacterium]|nr:glycerol-3-phosphate acyltransferase [Clostridia bacterium]